MAQQEELAAQRNVGSFAFVLKLWGLFENHVMMPEASRRFVCAQRESTENEAFKTPTNTHAQVSRHLICCKSCELVPLIMDKTSVRK